MQSYYVVETADGRRTGHTELQWAENAARIRSGADGSALLWGLTEEGTEILLQTWSQGERYGQYRPSTPAFYPQPQIVVLH